MTLKVLSMLDLSEGNSGYISSRNGDMRQKVYI